MVGRSLPNSFVSGACSAVLISIVEGSVAVEGKVEVVVYRVFLVIAPRCTAVIRLPLLSNTVSGDCLYWCLEH